MHAEGKNRRRQERHPVPAGTEAAVSFGWPDPSGHPCRMPVRDLSAGGLSFVLAHELPGLSFGRLLSGVELAMRGGAVRLDLLVVHVSDLPEQGTACGCLLYPATDADLRAYQALLASLAVVPAAGTAR